MSLENVTTEDYDDAHYLSNQVEQAKRRAVLAASDAGVARDRAASAEQAANEAAKRAERANATIGADATEAKQAASEAVSAKTAAKESATQAHESAEIASGVAGIAGNLSNRLTGVESMAGIGPSTPVDGQTANLIEQPHTLTKAALSALFVGKADLSVNVKDYGAIGDGVADDTAALQAAESAARSLGAILFMPSGRYKTTSTFTVRTDLTATATTVIEYYGTGTALVLGDPLNAVFNRDMRAPVVEYKTGPNWDGTSVGVEVVNLNTCTVLLRQVRGFEIGYKFIGRGTGLAYSTITLGYSNQNRIGVQLTQDQTGWCNQNTFIGGRIQLVAGSRGAVADDPGAHYFHFKQGSTEVSGPNNNTFIGCTMEGSGLAYYRMKFEGARYNAFVNCRFENYGSVYRIRFEKGSSGNVIQYGYDAWQMVVETDSTSSAGSIYDGVGERAQARSHSAQMIPSGVSTSLNGWGSQSLRRVTYDAVTGAFTPTSGGEWKIDATVIFAANAVGTRTAELLVGTPGGTATRISFDECAAQASGNTALKLSGRWKFNGTEKFWIAVTQNSGADLAIRAFGGNTTLYADKLTV